MGIAIGIGIGVWLSWAFALILIAQIQREDCQEGLCNHSDHKHRAKYQG